MSDYSDIDSDDEIDICDCCGNMEPIRCNKYIDIPTGNIQCPKCGGNTDKYDINNVNISMSEDGLSPLDRFNNACKYSRLGLIECILEYSPKIDVSVGIFTACKNNNLMLLSHLIKISNNNINVHIENDAGIKMAAKYNYVDIIEHLTTNFKNFDDEAIIYTLKKLCKTDNVKLFRKILRNHVIDIHHNNDDIFRKICKHGSINILVYVCNKYMNTDKPIYNNVGFYTAIKNNNYKLVFYLLNKYKNTNIIDIYSDNSEAFRLACANNYIEMAKLIYTHDVLQKYILNIHNNNIISYTVY